MHDASLFAQATGRSFSVLEYRYYLGDAGFGSRHGIVVPFPGVRYHLDDSRASNRKPETRKELFNLRHASLRAVVERAFGLLKKRFRVLRMAAPGPEYSIEKQTQIVYAATALHNFIRLEDGEDDLTLEEQGIMSLAKSRAMRVIKREDPGDIRLVAAHELWRGWQRWKLRELISRRNRRNRRNRQRLTAMRWRRFSLFNNV